MGLKSLAKSFKQESAELNKKPSDMFLKDFTSFVIQHSKDTRRASSLTIKPSSFYKCYRQLWYKHNNFPEKYRATDIRGPLRLMHGTYVHNMVQDELLKNMDGRGVGVLSYKDLVVYKESNGLIEFTEDHDSSDMEVKFRDYRHTDTFPVSAMVDGVIEYDNLQYIFEFKTINTRDFNHLFQPLPNHKVQGGLYSLCLGIPRVMFMYFDKNRDDVKVFIEEYKETQLSWVRNRLRDIDRFLSSEDLAPKEEGEANCKYCPYTKICEKDISTIPKE